MSVKGRVQPLAAWALASPAATRARHALGRRERAKNGGRRRVTFFHQVEDAASVLLSTVLGDLARAYDLDVEVVVVPPPTPDADPEPDKRLDHLRRDARELTRHLALAFPDGPDEIPPEPQVNRANAILLAERPAEAQLALVPEVGRALFAHEFDAMNALATEHGSIELSRIAAGLNLGRERLQVAGHYQGGMLHYEGDWYWGVDRIWHLERRLQAEGLAAPPAPIVAPRTDPPPATDGVVDENGRVPLELYFSFRSPYSYLGIVRMRALAETLPIDLTIRPVLPMVMRGMQVPRAKRFYIVRDVKREADRHGIPFGKLCDPVGVGVERCLAVFPYAERAGRGGEFLEQTSRGIWSEALDVATDAGLRTAVERAGLDWGEAQRSMQDPAWKDLAEANREALFALGLWGVPCFRTADGYTTWGQDRIWVLERRIRAALGQAGASS